MVYTLELIGQPGASYVRSSQLTYVNVLLVSRSDNFYCEIDGTPSGGAMDFQYDPTSGDINFDPDVPFTGDDSNDLREKVKIIYRR